MNEDYFLLSGVKEPEKLDAYFASSLVDVAYATPLADSKIMIELEAGTDLRKPADLAWIMEIITEALKANAETSATIETIYRSPPAL
jgi:hypothetical protein